MAAISLAVLPGGLAGVALGVAAAERRHRPPRPRSRWLLRQLRVELADDTA